MSEGYAYTTISVRPGWPADIGVSFFLDGHSSISVPGVRAGRPHLCISHGDVSVRIGPRTQGRPTSEDARIARELADRTAAYAAEIERLCAGDSTGTAGTAAE